MSIVGHVNLNDVEHKVEPLWWQKLGLSKTTTGYGRKIETSTMIKLPNCNRWRRVYICIYSSIGTCYVLVNEGKDWITIDD